MKYFAAYNFITRYTNAANECGSVLLEFNPLENKDDIEDLNRSYLEVPRHPINFPPSEFEDLDGNRE